MTFSKWNVPSKPLFQKLGILNIFQQHSLQLAMFVHDVLHKRLPSIFHDYFTTISHSYSTRQSRRSDLNIPRTKHRSGQFSIKYAGAKLWNKIPVHIRTIQCRSEFKREFKKCLQSGCFGIQSSCLIYFVISVYFHVSSTTLNSLD